MTESLVDEEDFPRADIDVYNVRRARSRINILRSDLSTLQNKIEDNLALYFAEHADNSDNNSTTNAQEEVQAMTSAPQASTPDNRKAFAKIGSVEVNSPAYSAGLRTDDTVLCFGSVNADNFNSLRQVADIVKHKENANVNVVVRRRNSVSSLNLVPQKWSGIGLLGCKLEALQL